MSAQDLSVYAGILLSFFFSYAPKISDWYNALDATYKRLIMAGALLLVVGGVMGLACGGLGADLGISVTCDKAGIIGMIKAFIAALIANQGAYLISPKKNALRVIFLKK